MKRLLAALCVLAFHPSVVAQQELGMTVTGDESAEIGLFIAKWMDGGEPGLPAPGLHQEPLLPVDPWVLRQQLAVEAAVRGSRATRD